MMTLKTSVKRGLCSLWASLFLFSVGCQTVPEGAVDKPVKALLDDELASGDSTPEEVESVRQEPTAPDVPGLVSLENALRFYGAELTPGLESSQWHISKGETKLTFVEGSRRAYWDGLLVFLNKPIVFQNKRLEVDEADVQTFLAPALDTLTFEPKSKLIVIDPGHGGTEEGAKNDVLGLVEKELALDVSKRLKGHLENLGYETLLTRYDDRLLPLGDRTEISNREKAALFISVHFNSTTNLTAEGLETYILTPEGHASTADSQAGSDNGVWPGNSFDTLNSAFSYEIQRDMLATLQREDRGLKKARFAVLKRLKCPGVLVECGFVSHEEEARLIRTPVYRERLARSLSRSIDAFYNRSTVEEPASVVPVAE